MNLEPFARDPEPGMIRTKVVIPRELYGKTVRVLIPEKWWSPAWRQGARGTVYLGRLCGHLGPEGDVCVQGSLGQAGPVQPCVPFNPEECLYEVLPGKLENYL